MVEIDAIYRLILVYNARYLDIILHCVTARVAWPRVATCTGAWARARPPRGSRCGGPPCSSQSAACPPGRSSRTWTELDITYLDNFII